MKTTLLRAVHHATDWLLIGVVVDVAFLPLSLLAHLIGHRPYQGLLALWWQSSDKLTLTGVYLVAGLAGWGLLVLVFWLIEGLRRAMGRNDRFPQD